MIKIEYIIHTDPKGGYWAEVPDIPGCVTEADTLEELEKMVRDAAEGCLFAYLEQMRQQTTSKTASTKFQGKHAVVNL
jgi:predicted RNase H-like HicB family nuclease